MLGFLVQCECEAVFRDEGWNVGVSEIRGP